LASQGIDGYEIICSAENHPRCISILEEHKLPITILRKENSSGVRSHSGARDNMYNVLSNAFKAGSDFNVHLEDDFLLSPDAIDLANWYYENFKNSPLAYMSYGLFNWGSSGDDYSGLEDFEVDNAYSDYLTGGAEFTCNKCNNIFKCYAEEIVLYSTYKIENE